ncbi:nucleotidyltransferase domain-containing protein [Microbacterium deminutum]|uniref:nucleotidyltransferase family protein n=1 Tax=Microbacterium deminutum TaxID=344164 RepID=UPI0031D1B5F8
MLDDDRIRRFAAELCAVDGVRAIALGGSRAQGTHLPDSDVDLGVYVDATVDLKDLEGVARRWTGGDASLSPRGGWGPWVDSGAWLVDFLLDGAKKGAKRPDVPYVALCAATAMMLVAHGWHAAAGRWVTNEKGVIPNVAGLPIDTAGFSSAAASVLGALGTTTDELLTSVATLRALPRPAAGG